MYQVKLKDLKGETKKRIDFNMPLLLTDRSSRQEKSQWESRFEQCN